MGLALGKDWLLEDGSLFLIRRQWGRCTKVQFPAASQPLYSGADVLKLPAMRDLVRMWVTSPERRRSRSAPKARLRPGVTVSEPDLRAGVWYDLRITQSPQPFYVWLETPHGAIAWKRDGLEFGDAPRCRG